MLPIGYPATLMTVTGGLLLGLGALVTRACVFGAIARLGSGDWAYALTPLGFFLGCATIWPLIGKFPAMQVASPLFGAGWLLVPFAVFVGWRMVEAYRAGRSGMFAAHIWTPHRATAVIGIVFAISLIAIGPWAYTYALLTLAQGSSTGVAVKLVLLAALFAGALVGGWTAGLLQRARRRARRRSAASGRGADGLGQPADPRGQRRAAAGRHPAAATLCVGGGGQHGCRHCARPDDGAPPGRSLADPRRLR